jgi:hypothetical protein
MKGKKALIVAELIDESRKKPNDALAKELFKWFRDEAVPAPWVKDVKKVVVQEF